MNTESTKVDLSPTITLALLCEILYHITGSGWYRVGTWFFGVVSLVMLALALFLWISARK